MKTKTQITIGRIFPPGGWIVSAIIHDHLVTQKYFGYTKAEALDLFREEFLP